MYDLQGTARFLLCGEILTASPTYSSEKVTAIAAKEPSSVHLRPSTQCSNYLTHHNRDHDHFISSDQMYVADSDLQQTDTAGHSPAFAKKLSNLLQTILLGKTNYKRFD